MTLRGWREEKQITAIPTPEGPLVVNRGDVVVVVVARSWERALGAVAQLEKQEAK